MNSGRLWRRAACVAAVAAALPLVLIGCGTKSGQDWPDKPGPKVVVSFAPLYCFAANVAGDDATVKNVMTTTGPHHFNPTEQDIRLLSKADIFFTVGLDLDNATADQMQKGSGNSRLKVVRLAEMLPKGELCEGKCTHVEHQHDPDHTHLDPHVWLSPDRAVLMVNLIRDELKAADPAHAEGYDKRAAEYVAKLRALKAKGVEMLKDRKDRKLVSFHDSLAYFEKDFGLRIEGVLTKKPGQEPDKKEMEQLIQTCRDKKVRLIAVEPQYSTSNSGESLRKELVNAGVADAALVEIDPLETVRPDDLTPDWYEKKMLENLESLQRAMR